MKDFKYHIKDCQECECDIPGCGRLSPQEKAWKAQEQVSSPMF